MNIKVDKLLKNTLQFLDILEKTDFKLDIGYLQFKNADEKQFFEDLIASFLLTVFTIRFLDESNFVEDKKLKTYIKKVNQKLTNAIKKHGLKKLAFLYAFIQYMSAQLDKEYKRILIKEIEHLKKSFLIIQEELQKLEPKIRLKDSLDLLDEGITDAILSILGKFVKHFLRVANFLLEGWLEIIRPLKKVINRILKKYQQISRMVEKAALDVLTPLLEPIFGQYAKTAAYFAFNFIKAKFLFLPGFLKNSHALYISTVLTTVRNTVQKLEDIKSKAEKIEEYASLVKTANALVNMVEEAEKLSDEILKDFEAA